MKKFLSILLSATMVMSLAACKGGSSSTTATTAAPAQTTAASAKEEAPAGEKTPAPEKAAEAVERTGHAVGGVCPFANPEGVKTYLDTSLRRFETVFPAAGSGNSAIELTCEELAQYAHSLGWVDVCKGWREEEA